MKWEQLRENASGMHNSRELWKPRRRGMIHHPSSSNFTKDVNETNDVQMDPGEPNHIVGLPTLGTKPVLKMVYSLASWAYLEM